MASEISATVALTLLRFIVAECRGFFDSDNVDIAKAVDIGQSVEESIVYLQELGLNPSADRLHCLNDEFQQNCLRKFHYERVLDGSDSNRRIAADCCDIHFAPEVGDGSELAEQIHEVECGFVPFSANKLVQHAEQLIKSIEDPTKGADDRGSVPTSESKVPAFAHLLGVYSKGVSDERFQEVRDILDNHNLTVSQKLTAIHQRLPIPPTASANDLAEMLGKSKQAVAQSSWWKSIRSGSNEELIERRHYVHRNRGKLAQDHELHKDGPDD